MNAAILPGASAGQPDFLLAVEALTVSFDGFKAVNDVSFYVDPDEIRVIIRSSTAARRPGTPRRSTTTPSSC
ncbi:hypothetical protein ACQKLZ_32960, partial [Methylobacterium tarhaniae]